MSIAENIACLLDRSNFIKDSKPEDSFNNLFKNETLKLFQQGLVELIKDQVDANPWRENYGFLQVLDEIQTEINNKQRGHNMEPTAVGIALLLTGVAIGVYYAQQQEKSKGKKNSSNKPEPEYKPHTLLLIILANKLPLELVEPQTIDYQTIASLIAVADRAYCFPENNEVGKQIRDKVKISDISIDRSTENWVFVQLEISAEPDVVDMVKKNRKLEVREKIDPKSNGKLIKIKGLESSRSIDDFFQIY